jgi:hypothetical protein
LFFSCTARIMPARMRIYDYRLVSSRKGVLRIKAGDHNRKSAVTALYCAWHS